MFPTLSKVVSEMTITRSTLASIGSGSSTTIAPKRPAKIWSATSPVEVGVVPVHARRMVRGKFVFVVERPRRDPRR